MKKVESGEQAKEPSVDVAESELKGEEVKAEEVKTEEGKNEEVKGEEVKAEGTPAETEVKNEEEDLAGVETNSEVIDRLCKYVYTKGLDRVRTRAMLCHIYNHALHDRLYEARDLMLISHLQGEIQHSDIPTQVRLFSSS